METLVIEGKRANSTFIRKLGTILNLKDGIYKSYDRFLGLTSGAWKKIPKIDYVLLFKTLYIKCEGCSPEDFENDQGAIYQLSLVYHKNRKLIVHESKVRQDVFSLANQLANFYAVKIRDSATNRRKPIWMDGKI